MFKNTLSGAVLVAFAASGAFAAGGLSRANVITVEIEMGSNDDGMYFKPNTFEFETGQAYKLRMINVDEIKHEVSLNEMYERIFTRKVEIEDADGELVAEIKGSVREVEVGPHKTVDWYFVPIQPVSLTEISCELEGHKEAGMRADAAIN